MIQNSRSRTIVAQLPPVPALHPLDGLVSFCLETERRRKGFKGFADYPGLLEKIQQIELFDTGAIHSTDLYGLAQIASDRNRPCWTEERQIRFFQEWLFGTPSEELQDILYRVNEEFKTGKGVAARKICVFPVICNR